MTQQDPAPGWYPDGAGGERWWDGRAWTEARRAARAAESGAPSGGDPAATQIRRLPDLGSVHRSPEHPASHVPQQQRPVQSGPGPAAPVHYGGFAPPVPPARRGNGGLIGLVVVLALLLLGSVIGIAVLVADRSDDEADDPPSRTSEPEPEPEGPPTDATEEEFCAALLELEFSGGRDRADLRDFGEDLSEVGTPESISDNAREGYEIYLELFDEAGNRATIDDFIAERDALSSRDDRRAGDFDDYIDEVCNDSNIYA